MRKPTLNRLSACDAHAGVREHRIQEEIVVDAYTAEERAMSWTIQ